MKKLIMFIALILAVTVSFAQLTPEQKKQVEEAKKKAAEAQKQLEKMMNNPEMKKMMEQAKKQDALYEAERKKQKSKKVVKKTQQKKKGAVDYYWYNKIASNTQGKFSNWSFGKADLKIGFYERKSKSYEYLKIGEISDQGQVTISLPNIDSRKWAKTPITTSYSEGDDLFYDLKKIIKHSNTSVKYFASRFSLNVIQGDKNLGTLSVANSVFTDGNLNAPCCSYKAGDGYIAYWVYMTDANTMQGKSNTKGQVIETNLSFKKGWNIVLTRVEGNVANSWKNKYHTATTAMPSGAKYYFMSELVKNK